jgi:tRNA A-37 threonylcarbamoyl transferase component Bud32
MGYVFEAEDEKLGRRVAVKVLTPELARKPEAAARFLREARTAAAVEHENVVPILHVGEEVPPAKPEGFGGVPYIVMPLLRGESLADRIRRDRNLPLAEVLRIGRDVAAGLGAAHSRGLVHRDMKPANVWLDADTGRARVLDFGLARLSDGADALTDSRALMGTPAYMAPEQLDGQPATPRSDLFGLGATLYECATGVKAFDGPSITAILNAVNECRPKPLTELNPEVPAALAALIGRLLAKDPAGRPADARAVIAGLDLRSTDDGVPTDTWVEPGSRTKGKPNRRGWFIGGGIVAVVAAVVIVWLATRSPAPAVVEVPSPKTDPSEPVAPKKDEPRPVQYRGRVDVRVARTVDGREKLLRLNEFGALPLKQNDPFVIEAEVDPPAYVYVVWVDPDHDITPVYPWDAKKGWGSRPPEEQPVSRLVLPPNVKNRYRAPQAKPGIATIVMFARPDRLDVPDDVVRGWFEALPEIPLPESFMLSEHVFKELRLVSVPPSVLAKLNALKDKEFSRDEFKKALNRVLGSADAEVYLNIILDRAPLPQNADAAAAWFENFTERKDPQWLRTYGKLRAFDETASVDPFVGWQGQLQKALGGRAQFQTAVSFARTGRK